MIAANCMAQDIRSALRVLLANRGFAAATLLTVALGVGGTAGHAGVGDARRRAAC